MVTLSVVSHQQNALVNTLVADLRRHASDSLRIIVTENVPDGTTLECNGAEVIANHAVKGFAANHNTAFTRCRTPYFCVCNPDVRLSRDPFPGLIGSLREPAHAVVGPLVRTPLGQVEDSARRFPTLFSLLRKAIKSSTGPAYPIDQGPIAVDWVAGMFMLFRSEDYRAVRGFDESYFLYYEDVDICRRIGRAGGKVIFNPQVEVLHDARRASRRNPRLARHHLASAIRFLADR